jgi:hypothetical protein
LVFCIGKHISGKGKTGLSGYPLVSEAYGLPDSMRVKTYTKTTRNPVVDRLRLLPFSVRYNTKLQLGCVMKLSTATAIKNDRIKNNIIWFQGILTKFLVAKLILPNKPLSGRYKLWCSPASNSYDVENAKSILLYKKAVTELNSTLGSAQLSDIILKFNDDNPKDFLDQNYEFYTCEGKWF